MIVNFSEVHHINHYATSSSYSSHIFEGDNLYSFTYLVNLSAVSCQTRQMKNVLIKERVKQVKSCQPRKQLVKILSGQNSVWTRFRYEHVLSSYPTYPSCYL